MASNNHGQTSNGPVKVALWCVARSASTAFTKCICGIQDLEVHLEPYSYAATVSSIFAATGRELPVEYVGNGDVYEEANDAWKKTVGGRLFPRNMYMAVLYTSQTKTLYNSGWRVNVSIYILMS